MSIMDTKKKRVMSPTPMYPCTTGSDSQPSGSLVSSQPSGLLDNDMGDPLGSGCFCISSNVITWEFRGVVDHMMLILCHI